MVVAVLVALMYAILNPTTVYALVYSVFVGMVYAMILMLSSKLSDTASERDPRQGMMVLYAGAVIRFLLVGALLAIGIRNWVETPLPVVLPFMIMLFAPMLLLINKKRLTD